MDDLIFEISFAIISRFFLELKSDTVPPLIAKLK